MTTVADFDSLPAVALAGGPRRRGVARLLEIDRGLGRLLPEEQLRAIRSKEMHPMEAKKALASELVGRFHGEDAAAKAAHFFEERFQKRTAHEPTPVRVRTSASDVWICQLIKDVGFASSTSEARRLVAQGAVRVDGQAVDLEFRFRRGINNLLEVGRRRVATVTFDESA